MLLLGASQEVTKKSDFGKPKSQVCLFAKREHRASAGANIASPDVPSWNSLGIAALHISAYAETHEHCLLAGREHISALRAEGQGATARLPPYGKNRSPHSHHERQAEKASAVLLKS